MPLEVRLDDRVRLAACILAAGDLPDMEQAQQPYKPHRVAAQARQYFAVHRDHSLVALFDQYAREGNAVAAFAQAAQPSPDVAPRMAQFSEEADVPTFLALTAADWQQSEADARTAFATADVVGFLELVFGPLPARPVFVPNLLFPGLYTAAVRAGDEWLIIAPPPKAWGTSPPWRYSERPDEVLSDAVARFAGACFRDIGRAQPFHGSGQLDNLETLFAPAAAALFLREAVGPAEADAFLMVEKKARNLPALPQAVAALERCVALRRSGAYRGLLDYLPRLVEEVASPLAGEVR